MEPYAQSMRRGNENAGCKFQNPMSGNHKSQTNVKFAMDSMNRNANSIKSKQFMKSSSIDH